MRSIRSAMTTGASGTKVETPGIGSGGERGICKESGMFAGRSFTVSDKSIEYPSGRAIVRLAAPGTH